MSEDTPPHGKNLLVDDQRNIYSYVFSNLAGVVDGNRQASKS